MKIELWCSSHTKPGRKPPKPCMTIKTETKWLSAKARLDLFRMLDEAYFQLTDQERLTMKGGA